jgi:hypothetical protein
MSLAFVIEVNSEVVGLAVREDGDYRFHAVDRRLFHLEDQLFASPLAAERASRQQQMRQAHSISAQRSAQLSC